MIAGTFVGSPVPGIFHLAEKGESRLTWAQNKEKWERERKRDIGSVKER